MKAALFFLLAISLIACNQNETQSRKARLCWSNLPDANGERIGDTCSPYIEDYEEIIKDVNRLKQERPDLDWRCEVVQ